MRVVFLCVRRGDGFCARRSIRGFQTRSSSKLNPLMAAWALIRGTLRGFGAPEPPRLSTCDGRSGNKDGIIPTFYKSARGWLEGIFPWISTDSSQIRCAQCDSSSDRGCQDKCIMFNISFFGSRNRIPIFFFFFFSHDEPNPLCKV